MPERNLRIWCNQAMPENARRELEQRAAGHEIILAERSNLSNLALGEPDPIALQSDIAFGQPHVEDIIASTQLKWIHLSTAGYTRYDREDLRTALRARGAAMSNSSTVYADPCAQHALAMMLSLSRRLPPALVEQQNRRWTYSPLREDSRLLTGQSALIVGLGAIGRRLIELLAPFRMQITAVRRSPRSEEALYVRRMDEIERLLPRADHVINLLPSGSNTRNFFNAERFARMKRGGLFYNVGRGDTVDQHALIESLRWGHLSGAYLDVTDPEPLPPDHPLWSAPNCYITPHIAGGQQDEYEHLVDHFIENLSRYERGEPLKDRVM